MLEGFVKIPILQGSSFVSITDNGLNFNKNVVKHMQKAENIVIFYNSNKKQIAIQKCEKNTEDSIPFYRSEKNLQTGVRFNNREIQQMIASMMNWDLKELNYRVDGFLAEDRQTMIFDLKSARIFSKKNKSGSNQMKALEKNIFDV